MEEQGFIFITGGVRSGKSSYAEKYAQSIQRKTGGNLTYIATSRPVDGEMVERIRRHREDRDRSGYGWKTVECPVDLFHRVNDFSSDDIVLLDCLTIWLTNELFRPELDDEQWRNAAFQQQVFQSMTTSLEQLQNRVHTLVLVSNEVLNDVLPEGELSRVYCRLIGRLHQWLVAMSTQACLIESGISIQMKGCAKK